MKEKTSDQFCKNHHYLLGLNSDYEKDKKLEAMLNNAENYFENCTDIYVEAANEYLESLMCEEECKQEEEPCKIDGITYYCGSPIRLFEF